MEKSKKNSFLIILLLFAFLSTSKAQVSINHVQLKFDSIGYDSVRIDYTSYLGELTYWTGNLYNDHTQNCVKEFKTLVFSGKLDTIARSFDTIFRLGYHGYVTNFFELKAVWDTTPNPFPPSYISVMDSFLMDSCHVTSIVEKKNNWKVSVYPNPANNKVRIETNIAIINIELYTLNGQLVQSFPAAKSNLNVSQLPNGIYLLRIRDKKQTITKKVMVKH